MSHHVPDGLSQRPCVDDDLDVSGDDIDIDDGIKLVKALPIELQLELEDDYEVENGLQVSRPIL